MNLERLIFIPRIRRKWEAADLGFRLVALFWKPMLLSWLIISLPIFLLCSVLEPLTAYATFILWWLKPIFERTQLHILSYGIFGQSITAKQTLKSFPQYGFKQILPSLIWRRISFTRSMDLPVLQLENLNGEKRKKRIGILHQKAGNTASWLSVILVHVEALLMIGLFMVLLMFIPSSIDIDWFTLLEEYIWLGNIIYYLCILVVAPFYVASGFMLYINRRIQLEGWDIELSFKDIASKHKASTERHTSPPTTLSAILVMVVILGGFFSSSEPAFANQDALEIGPCTSESCFYREEVNAAKNDVLQVFEHEDFHQIDTYEIPKWIDGWEFDKDDTQAKPAEIPEWLAPIIMFISYSLEFIIWSIFIGVLLYLVFRYRFWIARFAMMARKSKTKKFDVPKTLFGLDVRQDHLPDDIQAASLLLLESEDLRGSLSLLYRATIIRLIHEYEVPFTSASTELECSALTQRYCSTVISDYFNALSKSWRELAYGHIAPQQEDILHLCSQWHSSLNSKTKKLGEQND